ncbi:GGDEF domain-containing protein [Larsenimonas rhizosphaerae]|uniref:GGDEF domain-containing protein n=1 Tax=Larsenimonas rhizosphaerae TaxID=2944682 RepID=UPI00203342F1|nr:GGDEF domain-containing protein [Larsenimonas rhizosphaerae]MCM2131699.1 GGDEF domain-containing protein [Larsenimonas rhizosphaerae]
MLKHMFPKYPPASLTSLQLRLYTTFWYANILALLTLVPYLVLDLFVAPLLWPFHAMASVLVLYSQLLLQYGHLRLSQLMSLSTCLGIVVVGYIAFGKDSGIEYFYFPLLVSAVTSSVWPLARRVMVGLITVCAIATLLTSLAPPPWVTMDSGTLGFIKLYNLLMTVIMLAFIMTRIRTLVELLGKDADIDPLTHTLNRRAFYLAVNRLQQRRQAFALLLLDLDHFKTINDTHGHEVGDQVLVHVTRLLKQHNQRNRDVLSRYGGEEFLLLLHDASPEQALQTSQAIRNTLAVNPFKHDNTLLTMTVSIGISLSSESRDIDKVIALADERLYKAKSTGRDRAVLYHA